MKDDLRVGFGPVVGERERAEPRIRTKIARLQQQLAQRTEVGESLKSQLASLSGDARELQLASGAGPPRVVWTVLFLR